MSTKLTALFQVNQSRHKANLKNKTHFAGICFTATLMSAEDAANGARFLGQCAASETSAYRKTIRVLTRGALG